MRLLREDEDDLDTEEEKKARRQRMNTLEGILAGEEDIEDHRSYLEILGDAIDTWTFKLHDIRSGIYILNLPEKTDGDEPATFNEAASKALYAYCKEKWFWTPTLIQLLEIGADPNYVATNDYCNTPLHLLARKARWLGFHYLVQAGANVNAVNTLMQTPLILACDSDIAGPRLRIIDIILKQPGAVLDARDAGGTSALGAAVFKNNIWIVSKLLKAGLSVAEGDTEGRESAYYLALWIFAASFFRDIDQLPMFVVTPTNWWWKTFSWKGRYEDLPIMGPLYIPGDWILWFQSLYNSNSTLVFRMVQLKHQRELKEKKDWHKETLAERMEKERKRVAAREEKEFLERREARMKELRESKRKVRAGKKMDERDRLAELLTKGRIKKIDEEYDKGIYSNRTLRPYDWERGDGETNGPNGEWRKVPPKTGLKVYTLPPKVEKYTKRVGASPSSPDDRNLDDNSDEEKGEQGYNGGPPIEGNPIRWYKNKKGGWTQMAQDRLGWVDPTASYGRQLEREKEDRKKEEELIRQ